MFLLFSKQNKSRYQLLGIIVVSVSILKGVIVKSQLLVALSPALVRIVMRQVEVDPGRNATPHGTSSHCKWKTNPARARSA
jgi:hypothetical protein